MSLTISRAVPWTSVLLWAHLLVVGEDVLIVLLRCRRKSGRDALSSPAGGVLLLTCGRQ